MAHRFTVKQIAAQAGVSAATVDRVRHGREHVHEQTRRRVEAAIRELEEQAEAGIPPGFGLTFDVLLNSPERFSQAVRRAFVAAAADMAPLRIAPRFHADERMAPTAIAARLRTFERKATHGIVLKAPAHPDIVAAVDALAERGIPVVTFVTDIETSRRIAYVGIDNAAAGQTAAFLLSRFLGARGGRVLANLGSRDFHGETDRWRGFAEFMAARCPNIDVVTIDGGYGLDHGTYELARAERASGDAIAGIYSMGGGNRGLLRALDEAGDRDVAFVGHDLDDENRRLLRAGRIDAVVDHDLQADAAGAIRHLLSFRRHGRPAEIRPSRAVIVTPWNL
ncbi:LacI family DNA-binding transcriptional regulator [Salinisphaera hydrothermalis]|uniref:Dna-binding protein n=1 Tax=Salinisphaera hydrothermalis (strain C41B8) TaxID=1304275 RepID=A0A084IMK6_SALHC|nr:LacI family DNA-binding transcriptional regulator [Salinisphaera hydrothermalis]KEZ77940.1 dna-binding protein [Salinisphaera hydrothermalis C41B8]